MCGRPRTGYGAVIALSLFGVSSANALGGDGKNWPSFRGTNASGVAEGHPTATEWDVASKKNVRWETPIAGLAHSSPIIWGDRLFVTTAVPASGEAPLKVGLYGAGESQPEDTAYSWRVLCLDKKSGKVLWDQEACSGQPRLKRHPKATQANCTPATDGSHLVAFFASEGLYCYDFDGKLKWKKDLGVLESGPAGYPGLQWGFAASPIIHDRRVIIQCDAQNAQYLAAFDVMDGREIWRTPRTDDPTWSTPAVVTADGRTQIVCNGYKQIAGYDASDGKLLWHMKGGGDVPVPTPLFANDLIFITNAHGAEAPIFAIKPTATGDITLATIGEKSEHVAWSRSKRGIYMQTPIAYRDHVYFCRDNGVLTAYEAKTGEQTFRERLGSGEGGFTASAVAADGKLYVTSEEGDVYVIKADRKFQILKKNAMGEICMATPAISEGVIYFRTQKRLIAIGP